MMSTSIKRSRTKLVLGLSTAIAFAGASVVVPGTAAAQCAHTSEVRLNLVAYENGQKVEVAAERPKPGTCNGNNVYQGMVDSKREGWRASVWIVDGSAAPVAHYGKYDDDGGVSYTHSDVDDDSHFEMWLCIDNKVKHYCGVAHLAEWSSDWDFEPVATIFSEGH